MIKCRSIIIMLVLTLLFSGIIPVYADSKIIFTVLPDSETYNEWGIRENGGNVWFWKNGTCLYKKNILGKSKVAELTLNFSSSLEPVNEGFVFSAPRVDASADNAYIKMQLYQEVADGEKSLYIRDSAGNNIKIPFEKFCTNEKEKWMDIRIPMSYIKNYNNRLNIREVSFVSIYWEKSDNTLKTAGSSEKVYITDMGFYKAKSPEKAEITNVSENGIQLEWDGTEADTYKVFRDNECIAEVSGTNYTDNIGYDGFSEYKISAVYSSGVESAFSDVLKNPFTKSQKSNIEIYDEGYTRAWEYVWPSDGSISEITTDGHESSSSLQFTFKPGLSWGNILIGFYSPISVEGYKKDGYISMYIRSSKATDKLSFTLMNTDDNGNRVFNSTEIKSIAPEKAVNGWSEVRIPFSEFNENFEFRAITGIRFLYTGSSETEPVTVCIDKIRFVSDAVLSGTASSGISPDILESDTYYCVVNEDEQSKLYMAYYDSDGLLKRISGSVPSAGKAFAMMKTDSAVEKNDKIKIYCWNDNNKPIKEIGTADTSYYSDAGNINEDKWFVYDMPDYESISGTALDMSYLLDAPAGKHGKISAKGDNFVFEDGTKARFWGVNVVGKSNFMNHEDSDALVEAIAASGANIVRIHHLDANFYSPNIFGSDKDSVELDENQMEKFNYLWAKLKEKGIYIMPGLLCSRVVTSAMGITDADTIDAGMKIEGIFDRALINLQKDYAKKLLTYPNPYTGTTLAGDPAAVLYEVHNECNITQYGEDEKYSITSDYYLKEFYDLFNDWLVKKYKTNSALKSSWGSLGEGESLTWKTITFPANYKSLGYSENRMTDCREFLYDLACSYHTEMIDYLKNELNISGMAAGVNNITNELGDIHENANYDHMDRHIYWSHPSGGSSVTSGVYTSFPTSMLEKTGYNIFNAVSRNKVMGKPIIVSEWQYCHPNQYIAEGQLMGSAVFSYQGWNSVQFDFINNGLPYENKLTDAFQIMGDPIRSGLFPAAALIYLRGDVREAQTGYYTSYTKADAVNINEQVSRQPDMMFMLGKSGIVCEDITEYEESNTSLLNKLNDDVLVSDTDELAWDKPNRIFTLNTPRTKGAAGFIKYRNILLDEIEIMCTNDYAVWMLTSVDGEDISQSSHMLLTVGARERNTGYELDYSGSKILDAGTVPAMVEAVEGKMTIKADGDFTVYVLNASGQRIKKADTYKNSCGDTILNMTARDKTLHYEIVKQ